MNVVEKPQHWYEVLNTCMFHDLVLFTPNAGDMHALQHGMNGSHNAAQIKSSQSKVVLNSQTKYIATFTVQTSEAVNKKYKELVTIFRGLRKTIAFLKLLLVVTQFFFGQQLIICATVSVFRLGLRKPYVLEYPQTKELKTVFERISNQSFKNCISFCWKSGPFFEVNLWIAVLDPFCDPINQNVFNL
uniref:Uncharacterized protein n=1 Tax=Glossina pallidipes TaxID=7398 RepID=A0A1A9ZN22_GLOPL